MINRPWTEWPLVGVTLNPIKGPHLDYYAFCDLCVLRRTPDGVTETVVDSRVRCLTRWGDVRCIGDFTSEETERFDLVGYRYPAAARPAKDVLEAVCFGARGSLPVAVNPKVCQRLLYKAVRLEEGAGPVFDRSEVFVLRERSRWVNLGAWMRHAKADGFSGLKLAPKPRVVEALDRLPVLAAKLGIDPKWTVKELLDWQDRITPRGQR